MKRYTRRRKSRRRQRGGQKPRNIGRINWPAQDGCLNDAQEISVLPGIMIDRFGPPSGNYVSPVSITQYSYSERALPYYGTENKEYTTTNGKAMNREQMYYSDFSKSNIQKDDYHIYKVLKPIQGAQKCKVAPSFNYPGNGIQFKLPKTVSEYLADGTLKEIIDFPIVPRFK